QSATKEVITKLVQTLPITEKRTTTLKSLYDRNFASEIDYLASERERIQATQDLATERQRLRQLQAAEREASEQINLHRAQVSSTLLIEITELNRQITALDEELIKANDVDAMRILYAPVTGRVQDLAVNTVGGVVTEAQQLMLI